MWLREDRSVTQEIRCTRLSSDFLALIARLSVHRNFQPLDFTSYSACAKSRLFSGVRWSLTKIDVGGLCESPIAVVVSRAFRASDTKSAFFVLEQNGAMMLVPCLAGTRWTISISAAAATGQPIFSPKTCTIDRQFSRSVFWDALNFHIVLPWVLLQVTNSLRKVFVTIHEGLVLIPPGFVFLHKTVIPWFNRFAQVVKSHQALAHLCDFRTEYFNLLCQLSVSRHRGLAHRAINTSSKTQSEKAAVVVAQRVFVKDCEKITKALNSGNG